MNNNLVEKRMKIKKQKKEKKEKKEIEVDPEEVIGLLGNIISEGIDIAE